MQAQEQVYVIGSPSSPLVKIGRSTNVSQRLASLQRSSPVPLAVLGTYTGAPGLEAALHRRFRDRRQHGEWFDLGTDPLESVGAAVQEIAEAARKARTATADRAVVIEPCGITGICIGRGSCAC